MSKPTSKWVSINGEVPQEILRGPELFILILSYSKSVATVVKFVDDSTLVDNRSKNTKSDKMQKAAMKQ